MACSKYSFPEEMTIEILKRVPVRSLVHCKYVCKSWRSTISDPQFIKTYSCYQQNLADKETSILMIARSGSHPLPPLVSPDFKCHLYDPGDFTVVGSCNGIICLVFELHCYLWNPVTKKCKEVPEFPSGRKFVMRDEHIGNLAFYFDTISNDYKVIRYICEESTADESPVLELYSTTNNSWKEIRVHDISPTKVISYPYLKLGPLINGAIYMGRKEYVVSFNLHTEVCTVVPIPSSAVRYSDMLNFQGSVAVIFGSTDKRPGISLWTLDNIHDNVSWTKKFNIVEDRIGWVYSCLGGGLLFGRVKDSAVLFLYDYVKKDFKNMPLSDWRLKTFLKHTESLASIEGLNDHDLYEFKKKVSLI